ncbi:MAG: DNA/RNA helicase domain-containing protein [Terriglobales bacterium]
MPAYYRASLQEFVDTPESQIEATLAEQNARAAFPLQPEALFAWKAQLPELKNAAHWLIREVQDSQSWSILLEYPIPRVGKRIDAVILARDVIVAVEVKTGTAPTSAARQVDDYALNLACFHEGSASRPIVPLVVADAHVAKRGEQTTFDHLIQPCMFATFAEIGPTIQRIVCTCSRGDLQVDANAWDEAQFKPIPPIIDAAVALYSNMSVFEIGHSCAAREDLQRTTNTLVQAVCSARNNGTKTICFVTGIPGAGKTLVGLNAVHEPEIRNAGSFLSGNGPLVKIIREALIRDVVGRTGATRMEARLKVQTFIQNVHHFADGFHANDKVPNEHVVVFDEAQRAWDLTESQRAGRELSEPEMILQIMDRHKDWAVIVALVGGGQEINRGEAGLAEWGRALANFSHWQVVASPEILQEGANLPSFTLFEERDQNPERVHVDESLHLKVAVRSIRAQKISDWVNAVLAGEQKSARAIAVSLAERPQLTRSLGIARAWLTEKRRGFTRAGLVGSAAASRLRRDGLEPSFDFHRRFDWENWFLDTDEDVRCSSRLEVFATQFEVQGLELDWVGVCWGEDFIWNGSTWISNRFNNKRWIPRKMTSAGSAQKHQYRINAYRVLLTRARQGMVIYVPQPSLSDESRLHLELEQTAAYLVQCGAVELPAIPTS